MDSRKVKSTNLSFVQQIIVSVILIDIYYILGFGFRFGQTVLFVIQILLFMFVLSANFDLRYLVKPIHSRLNLVLLAGTVVIFLFLYSSFYVNYQYNTNLDSIIRLISYPVVIVLFFFIFSKMLFENGLLFEKFLNLWVIFALLCTFIAFASSAIGFDFNNDYGSLHSSIFRHPNTYAFIFTFAVPMVIYKYFSKRISLMGLILAESFLMVGLLLTNSRAAYIGVFVAILIITYRKSKITFFLGAAVLVFLALTFFLSFAIGKNDSSISRTQIILVALSMILFNGGTRFLWGYGVTHSTNVFRSEISVFGPTRVELDPHNFVLLLGIQFGVLLTLAVIICIIILLIKVYFLRKKQLSFEINQRIGLSNAIVVGILLENLFEDMIVYPESFIMLMFLIFLGYLYYSVYYHNNTNDSRSTLKNV